jgi:hypothetical protein
MVAARKQSQRFAAPLLPSTVTWPWSRQSGQVSRKLGSPEMAMAENDPASILVKLTHYLAASLLGDVVTIP